MRSIVSAALLSLAAPTSAHGAPAPKPPASPAGREQALAIQFEKYTLPNGLEVILSHDDRLPVVAVNLWYHVGAFHEQPGRTGFAHLFEHMMFQGSRHVGDDVHISMLERLGATSLNGTTNFDRTNYFQTVPSHHLETALWLESDRMGFLLDIPDEAELQAKLDNQREVVKNERRQNYETAPYGLAIEQAWHALFPAPHPYHGRVIGSMADLDAATLDDVRAFFETWYAPSNATLAIVGDFDPKTIRGLIEKYFGSLPARPKPAAPEVEPASLSEPVEIRAEEKVASLPLLQISWHTPAFFEEGDATADVLAIALSSGKSSRLYQRLVVQERLAQSVVARQQSMGAQSIFVIQAVARPGASTDRILAEIDDVLAKVREEGLTEQEIQQARNRFETSKISGLQLVGGFGGKADLLQGYNHFLGDPGKLAFDLDRYEGVDSEKVQAFAKEYLGPNRVVLHAIPPGQAGSPTASRDAAAATQKGGR